MQNITELIAHPEKLDKMALHELREQIAIYPYYSTLRILLLKGLYLTHDPSFGEELRHAALYIPDRNVLFSLIEGDYYTLKPAPRKPKPLSEEAADGEEGGDRTLTLIEAFLSGQRDEAAAAILPDDGGLSAEYTTYVLGGNEGNDRMQQSNAHSHSQPMRGQQLIDNFIKNEDKTADEESKEDTPPPPDTNTDILPPIEEEDGYFTETLAKIYIKQHRYAKALEIIKRLSLKYPKKNAYFADQISFLEKLIKNSDEK